MKLQSERLAAFSDNPIIYVQVSINQLKKVYELDTSCGKEKLEKNRNLSSINNMHNEFTALIEEDGDCYVAYCPEVRGANGQGKTIAEAKASLAEAISLILEDRRADALKGIPESAVQETVVIG